MEKYIPYEKLSKRKRRELDASRRIGWGAVNPVTRRSENPKAYNRKKAQQWKDDPSAVLFILPASLRQAVHLGLAENTEALGGCAKAAKPHVRGTDLQIQSDCFSLL